MPRMTMDLLVRCTGQAKRRRDESQEQFLRRITHLYCSERGIETIEGLSICRNLTVLYLYDNRLTNIENLSSCTSLTHLYLQNNSISCIRNLAPLFRLNKLYLNGNTITVVEGLETLRNLSELHVAQQHLPEGEKLLFDPRTIKALAGSLTVLNVSGNNLDSIEDLQSLTGLVQFIASDNQLTSMRELSQVLSLWTRLVKLELMGNPLCQKNKYRDRVITMGRCICTLDGREVSETERQFLLNWKAMRVARRKQQTAAAELGAAMAYSGSTKTSVSKSKTSFVKSALPLTLPALPARQLPRRTKRHAQGHEEISEYQMNLRSGIPHYAGYAAAQAVSKEVSEGLRLPEIPNQMLSLVTQKSSMMRDSLPVVQQGHPLSTVGWRPMLHVNSGLGP